MKNLAKRPRTIERKLLPQRPPEKQEQQQQPQQEYLRNVLPQIKRSSPKGDIRKAGERRRKTAEARGGYVADRQAATIMSCKHNFIQKD